MSELSTLFSLIYFKFYLFLYSASELEGHWHMQSSWHAWCVIVLGSHVVKSDFSFLCNEELQNLFEYL